MLDTIGARVKRGKKLFKRSLYKVWLRKVVVEKRGEKVTVSWARKKQQRGREKEKERNGGKKRKANRKSKRKLLKLGVAGKTN